MPIYMTQNSIQLTHKRKTTMKKTLLSAAVMLSSGLVLAGSALAASPATSTLNVSATITSDCTVATAPVNFGSVTSGSGAVATGSVDVTCTPATPYTIALDAGGNFNGTNRTIVDGSANSLVYALNDNTTGLPWGDDGTTIAAVSVSDTGTGILQPHIVGATLTGGVVPTGTYTDSVNVTVTY